MAQGMPPPTPASRLSENQGTRRCEGLPAPTVTFVSRRTLVSHCYTQEKCGAPSVPLFSDSQDGFKSWR